MIQSKIEFDVASSFLPDFPGTSTAGIVDLLDTELKTFENHVYSANVLLHHSSSS